MKLVGLALVAFLAVSAGYLVFSGCTSKKGFTTQQIEVFNRWRKEFGKLYSTPSESQYRMEVLLDNHDFVNKMNYEYNQALLKAGRPPLQGPMFALMPWSDIAIEEFQKSYTGANLANQDHLEVTESDDSSTSTKYGNIAQSSLGQSSFNPVIRQQGRCGSCWAFSAIATIEKHYWIYNGQIVDFSQQQLVDCDLNNNGCNGGWMTTAISHIVQKGIAPDSQYLYTGERAGYCSIDQSYQIAPAATTPKQMAFSAQKAIIGTKWGLSFGTGIAVSQAFYQLRAENDAFDVNLMNSAECNYQINHAVNIIEAGTENIAGVSRTWVKLQNSWGINWGNQGFIKIYTCSDSAIWGSSSVLIHGASTVYL